MVVCKFFASGNCRYGANCRFEHPQNAGGQNPSQNRFVALSAQNGRSSDGKSVRFLIVARLRCLNLFDLHCTHARAITRVLLGRFEVSFPCLLESMSKPPKSRWGALPNPTSGSSQPTRRTSLTKSLKSSSLGRKDQSWAITSTDVKSDMTAGQGRPQWILSTYGPGRGPPASLLEDNEYSFEELRLRFYELANTGNEAQANQEAGALWTKAEEGMRAIAQNADDVIKFMEDANQKHPNRYDFCQMDGSKTREELVKIAEAANAGYGGGFGQATTTTGFGKPSFGQPAAATGFGQSGFGQPSKSAQSSNPFAQPSAPSVLGTPAFGQSGFGQPSQPAASGFGQPTQPSSFGAPSFGKPAQPVPAFGQPAQPASGFGQPSQPPSGFGQPSQTKSAFGQPSQAAQSANPFAKPVAGFGAPSQPASAFGQPSQPLSAFGQSSQPTTSAFGKPAASGGFAQSGFGQPSQPPAPGGFGQPTQTPSSGFGQPSQPTLSGFSQPSQPATTGFGQPSQPTSAGFGQSSQLPATSFGASSGFGAKSSSTSPFIQPAAVTGGFGQPTNSTGFGGASAASTGFGSTPNAQSAQIPNPLTGQPPASLHYTETIPKRATEFRAGTKDIQSYAGRRVQYLNDAPCYERPDGKGLERIWFPEFSNGADVQALNAPGKKDDLEGSADKYTQEIKQAYVHLFTKGGFGDGGMPTVPPMREWCAFDF